jgi:hypothetical protein
VTDVSISAYALAGAIAAMAVVPALLGPRSRPWCVAVITVLFAFLFFALAPFESGWWVPLAYALSGIAPLVVLATGLGLFVVELSAF